MPAIERENRLETAFRVEGVGHAAKVIREFIVASLQLRLLFIGSRFLFIEAAYARSLAKKCEKAGHMTPVLVQTVRARTEEKPERLCKWERTRSIDTLRVYSSVLSSLDKHVLFSPSSKTTTRVKCLLRRSTREQSKLFNLSSDLTRCTREKFYREEKLTEKTFRCRRSAITVKKRKLVRVCSFLKAVVFHR